jgi:soluble lytic murein transglycosylase
MLFLVLILSLLPAKISIAHSKRIRSLASIQHTQRIDHAKELLGDGYKKSVVSSSEEKRGLEEKLFKIVVKNLPKKFKSVAREIAHTIILESTRRSLDPYFVAAIIAGESSFNPRAVGPIGEIGMMQLRPNTAKWIADSFQIKWKGKKALFDPFYNIRLGTAYLAWLREKFDNQGQLYLAAYNMGPTSVKIALLKNVRPKDYPIHVMKRYLAFYKAI